MSSIYTQVEQAISKAEEHAKKCADLLEEQGLVDALNYCQAQGIVPPQCSLKAKSPNADKQRVNASRMLSEVK